LTEYIICEIFIAYRQQNSRIDHAISHSPTGPYIFKDVAVDVFSHNSAPLKLADGRVAIFHIGDGDVTKANVKVILLAFAYILHLYTIDCSNKL
jgi:hypothetical protein